MPQAEKTIQNLASLSIDDRRKIIDVFAWLIKEDKKQNPELYLPKKAADD